MAEKEEIPDELGELLHDAIAETHAGKADFEMGVVPESDGDSGMSFHSDEGAEDAMEVDPVIGTVLVLGAVCGSAQLTEVQGGKEGGGEEEGGEEEESSNDADDEAPAPAPAVPAQRERPARSLKVGLRHHADGKRYRVDVPIGIQKKLI